MTQSGGLELVSRRGVGALALARVAWSRRFAAFDLHSRIVRRQAAPGLWRVRSGFPAS